MNYSRENLNNYETIEYEELMDIYSPEGTKVRYIADNGFDDEAEDASKLLIPGEIYTVDRVDIGGWISYVWLKEVSQEPFNTVMFAAVKED